MTFTITYIFNHDPPDYFDNPRNCAQFEIFTLRSERLGRLRLKQAPQLRVRRRSKIAKIAKNDDFPAKSGFPRFPARFFPFSVARSQGSLRYRAQTSEQSGCLLFAEPPNYRDVSESFSLSPKPVRKQRWLFSAWGSRGDLHPFLGLGRRLIERGHTVSLVARPDWQHEIEQAGLTFLSSGERIAASVLDEHPDLLSPKQNGLASFRALLKYGIAPSLDGTAQALLQAAPEHDVLLAHHFSFAAPMVAELTGLSFGIITLAPGVIPSAYALPASHYGRVRRGGWARMWYRLMWQIGARKMAQMVDPVVNELRKSYGAAAIQNAMFEFPRAQINLQLYSRHFAAPAPDWSSEKKQGGFCYYDPVEIETLEKPLRTFLTEGEPPILITLGTFAVQRPGALYEEASRALQKLGRRGVLLVGDEKNRPPDLPKSIFAVPYAPLGLLMPHVAAVVHHGGIGTVAQTLRAGLPSVICPFAFDQPNNARRLEALNVAEVIRPSERRADKLAQALRRVFAGPAPKVAKRLGEILRAEDGAGLSCALLEKTFGT